MGRVKFSDLQLKMILHEVAVQHPNSILNPNLLGQLTEVPRHIWKMRMKEEIDLINDCNFVKEHSSFVSTKTGQPVTIVNYFEEFSKLAEKQDMDGILALAKDVMSIHYRLLNIAATKEENKQIEELSETNKKLKQTLASKEEELKTQKRDYESKLEQAEKKYYKLALCALSGFQENGIENIKTLSPFEKNKIKATNLLTQDFL
ncbi:hypothetical protein ACFCW7_00275 [Paenibacillus glucanolyticus]|uniref:hypothetical protein n=1 Tax=Paenibacillus glucanolyticus TaxID=59843 RepID=UPI0035E36D40